MMGAMVRGTGRMRSRVGMWVAGARPATLPLGLAPVAVAASLSWSWVMKSPMGGEMFHAPCPMFGGRPPVDPDSEWGVCLTSWQWYLAVSALCAVVAVGLQIAANYVNDYADGVRGADAGRGGDRGGEERESGAPARLVASGVSPRRVLLAAGIAAAVACLAGLGVVALTGHWWFIVLGVVCLLAAWAYTGGKHPYGYAGLGEAAAFVFFGLVPVLGTQVALMDRIKGTGVVGAIMCGCFAAAVMMVNNLRDIDADLAHGRRTLMARLGRPDGSMLYAVAMAVGTLTLLSRTLPYLGSAGVDYVSAAVAGPGAITGASSWMEVVLQGVALAGSFATVALAVRAARTVFRRCFRAALPLTSMTALVAALATVGTMLA